MGKKEAKLAEQEEAETAEPGTNKVMDNRKKPQLVVGGRGERSATVTQWILSVASACIKCYPQGLQCEPQQQKHQLDGAVGDGLIGAPCVHLAMVSEAGAVSSQGCAASSISRVVCSNRNPL